MRTLILLSIVAMLSGCGASLFNTGGQAHYTYSKCTTTNGVTECIDIDILNTKDIKSLSGLVEIKPDGTVLIKLDEKEADGSGLAKIQANNQTELINLTKSLIPGN